MMSKTFVFEGVDGVGKSTLLESVKKELEKTHNVKSYKEPFLDVDDLKKENSISTILLGRFLLYKVFINNPDDKEKDVINLIDRSYLSTLVYQPNANTEIYKFDKAFLLVKTPETIAEQVKNRGKLSHFDSINIETIKARQDAYLELAKNPKHKVVVLNGDEYSLEELTTQVLKIIKGK